MFEDRKHGSCGLHLQNPIVSGDIAWFTGSNGPWNTPNWSHDSQE